MTRRDYCYKCNESVGDDDPKCHCGKSVCSDCCKYGNNFESELWKLFVEKNKESYNSVYGGINIDIPFNEFSIKSNNNEYVVNNDGMYYYYSDILDDFDGSSWEYFQCAKCDEDDRIQNRIFLLLAELKKLKKENQHLKLLLLLNKLDKNTIRSVSSYFT